jgi:PEP-CTERM motif
MLVALFAGGALSARASLVSLDYLSSGDGLLTRDTVSALDWLDVTRTVNQTYDQVRTGSYYTDGFRHATKAELQTLFLHAGTPDDGYSLSQTYPFETRALARLVGLTILTTDRESASGFTGTDFFGNTVTTATHPIGTPFSALLGKINFLNPGTGEAHFAGGHPFRNDAGPNYGSFLVRPIPLPGTMILFGSGLIGFWTARARRRPDPHGAVNPFGESKHSHLPLHSRTHLYA